MMTPTSLPHLVHQWHSLTAELMPLCNPNAGGLAELSASEVERIRADAETLTALVGAWQILHRPAMPFAGVCTPAPAPQTTPIHTEV